MRFASSLSILAVALAGCLSLSDRDNPLDPAYNGPRGNIAGKVILRSGNALQLDDDGKVNLNYAGVEVAVDEFPEATTVTGKGGSFLLTGVPVGEWTLQISYAGYVTATVRNLDVKAAQTNELAPINLEEQIEGHLVFGSSRDGYPTLFRSNPYGGDLQSISALPIQSNRCFYAAYANRDALIVDTEFAVYEENGQFLSGAGLFIGTYPELEKVAILPADEKVSAIQLHPDGELVLQVEEAGDTFLIKAPLVKLLRSNDPEEFRITGSPDDQWEEMHPAVSRGGQIAYVRVATQGEETGYEIRVLEGDESVGRLVYQRRLLDMLEALSKQRFFDFDNNGEDDLIKFGTIIQKSGFAPILAGVDWSASIVAGNELAFLQGPAPDGIDINPLLIVLEILQLGEIWNLTWLPDDSALIFTDRLLSQPGYTRRLLWPIGNKGAPVTLGGVPVTDPATGRTTNYFHDLDGQGDWDEGVDRPFWFDNPGSYIEQLTLEMQRVEMQSLNLVRTDRTYELDEIDRFFYADANSWILTPAVSRDGKRVAIALGPVEHIAEAFSLYPIMTAGNIVTVDPANGFVTRITSDGLNNRAPCWVP